MSEALIGIDVGTTAVAATVRPRAPVEPVSAWVERYREQRERFRALYPALRRIR